MAKKKVKRVSNLLRFLVWSLGIVSILVLVFVIGFKIWVSSWQTYRNDEFDFSFRYPKNWHMGGTEVTKAQLSDKNAVFFWVDREKPEKVQGTTELKRSNGDVVISFRKNSKGTSEFFDKQSKSKFVQVFKFGNREGYINENIGNIDSLGNSMNEKYISIDLGNYHFSADTLTYVKNHPVGILIGLIQHKIGSFILDSFKFD